MMIILRTFAPALAVTALIAAPLAAQEAGSGGIWLKTDLSQRFELRRNADLDPGNTDLTTRSDTSLRMVLSSETRSDRLALSFGASLRHVEAPGAVDDVAFGLRDPSAALRYSHQVGHASFAAGLSVAVTDISYLDTLTDLSVDDNGDTVIEIDEEVDTGRRRVIGADAALRFGIGGPAELGFSLNSSASDYFGTSATSGYTDSRNHGLRASLALVLAPDLRLSSGLSFRRFEEDGASPRDTWALSNRLVRSLASGDLSASLNITRIEEGTRTSLGLGWSQPLPEGRIAVNLGVTHSASGQTDVTGNLSWNRNLPNGGINASFAHGFAANADDEETGFTNARVNWSRTLSPLTTLNLGLAYVHNDTGGGDTVTRSEFSAGISHMLSEDWTLNAGYRRIGRRQSGDDRAQSDSLFLNVGRSFATRF